MTKEKITLCPNCNCMTHTVKGNCGKCGVTKPNNEWEKEFGVENNWQKMPYYPNTIYPDVKVCYHCYCIEKEVKGKLHLECCMCGHRKLKFDKTI